MDPNVQNPVSPKVPASDPNTGIPTSAPEPTMPTPPPAMPAEPVTPIVPEPVAPVAPAEGTGDMGGGMPPTTPPVAI